MGMPDVIKRWTREEVLALPDDGNRYELLDGELLVTPSPRAVHQRAVAALFRRIDPYVTRHRLGVTGFAPSDLDLEGEDSVQPDLYVVPLLAEGRVPLEWGQYSIPILIAEVLSPSTARNDRIGKRRHYQRRGVLEYWIVDVDARTFERWRPDDLRPEVLAEQLTWSPDLAAEPLEIDLIAFFRDVLGEF